MSDVLPFDISPDERFLRLPEVLAKTGLGKTDLYERMNRGEFPLSRAYSGSRIKFWLQSEITAWQRDQIRRAMAA